MGADTSVGVVLGKIKGVLHDVIDVIAITDTGHGHTPSRRAAAAREQSRGAAGVSR